MTRKPIVTDPACYEIDSQNVIRSVNEAWLRFADANGASRLGMDDVLGRCLWDYIPDPDTLTLYQMPERPRIVMSRLDPHTDIMRNA